MITTAIVDACTTCNNGNGYFKEVKITRDDQNNIVAEFESITSNKGKFLLHIKTDASGDKYNTLEFMDQQGYYTPVYGTSLNMKQNDVSGNYITTGKFKTDLIDTIQYLQQMNEVLNKVSSDTPRNSQGNFFIIISLHSIPLKMVFDCERIQYLAEALWCCHHETTKLAMQLILSNFSTMRQIKCTPKELHHEE